MLGLVVGSFFLLAGHAGAEMGTATTGGKTLQDFQRDFGGTKPIVATQKYQEYVTSQAHRATSTQATTARPASPVALEDGDVTAERKTLRDFQRAYAGTKPIIAFQHYQDYLAHHGM